MRERFSSDRGASIFMLAISLFLLIGASAVAVDIAAIWLDRSTDQKVTDASAAAGALEAVNNGGEAGCQTALIYVATNTPDLQVGDVDLSQCVEFNQVCTDATLPHPLEVTAGRYDLTVVYPVDDLHDLMTSRIIGREPQDVVEEDGEQCERVGVKMTSTRNSLFAQVLGFGSGTTTVHTVARAIDGDRRPPFNLLVLDRTGCEAISVGGGGELILDAVIARDDDGNPTGGLAPGLAAADSDGSACGSGKGVINLDGGGSLIRADGPDQCSTWTSGTHLVSAPDAGPYTAYEGCGKIQVFGHDGTPGCSSPACNVSGGGNAPIPPPTPLGRRYTRQAADHLYNCHSNYTVLPGGVSWAADPLTGNQSIDSCELGTAPHIYNLIAQVGQNGVPDGFALWRDTHECNIGEEGATYTGNVVVNCNLQITGGEVTITGSVVFNGNVTVLGSGKLTVNTPTSEPWAFFRNGRLRKSGQGSIAFPNTMVYMSKTSDVRLTGGSGSLVWTAPTSGRFDGLALWTDSPSAHSWAGQANLTMEGVFFMPLATASYSGNGELNQTEAQWIAWRLEVSGNGALRLAPNVGKAIQPVEPRTVLIR